MFLSEWDLEKLRQAMGRDTGEKVGTLLNLIAHDAPNHVREQLGMPTVAPQPPEPVAPPAPVVPSEPPADTLPADESDPPVVPTDEPTDDE